jgi:hypothetical protein
MRTTFGTALLRYRVCEKEVPMGYFWNLIVELNIVTKLDRDSD